MKIERKTFHYIARQEESWMAEKTETSQEVVPAESVSEGLFGSKKVIKKGWRPLNQEEVLQQVYDFVNFLGKQRLVNLCEYTRAYCRDGDDLKLVWVVWYWSGN